MDGRCTMAKRECRAPCPVRQGWYVYAIEITPLEPRGYEWRVYRAPDRAPAGAQPEGTVAISRGTANNCDSAQRRATQARMTVMVRHLEEDALLPGTA